jgi:putative DNA primase/helicase
VSDEPESLQDEISAYLAGSYRNGDGHDHGALTDMANAARLIRYHGAELRYCHTWQRWLRWHAGRWLDDDTGYVGHLAQDTMRQLLHEAADIIDPDLRKKTIREVIAAERANRIQGMLRLAGDYQPHAVTPAMLDRDPWLFNVRNGTINLHTGQLRPHDAADLITKQAPVDYNPDAQAPAWRGFLERVIPDPELRHFLRRAVGYSLTGLTSEQILLILYGSGSNGKSTYTETILKLLGDYGQQSPPETFLEKRDGIPNDVARLRSTRFVLATEISEGRRLNESLVKRMTGGDTMTARFMRSEYFEFQPQFTPWLATNHRPEIRGTDHAIWRRVKLVPFEIHIPDEDQDHGLKTRLLDEFPGILAWAVRGCLDWQMDGLQEPDIVKAATAEYRQDMDVLGGFLDDCCDLSDTYSETAADLYRGYHDWLKKTGSEGLAARTFGLKLGERGFKQRRTGSSRLWLGLRLKTDQEDLGF